MKVARVPASDKSRDISLSGLPSSKRESAWTAIPPEREHILQVLTISDSPLISLQLPIHSCNVTHRDYPGGPGWYRFWYHGRSRSVSLETLSRNCLTCVLTASALRLRNEPSAFDDVDIRPITYFGSRRQPTSSLAQEHLFGAYKSRL